MTRRAIISVLTVWLVAAPCEAADDNANVGPTYQIDPRIDIPVLAVTFTIAFGWMLGPQLAPPHCAPQCDPDDVWAIDRFSAGLYDRTWKTASDIGVYAQFALAAGTLLVDEGFEVAVVDALVITEAISATIALSALSNMSTRRPRPHLYGTESPEPERLSGGAALSFFSGHTASAFAAAIGTFETLRRRHAERDSNYLVLGVGLAGGLFVGTARLLGGQHFLTDVLAGAIVGTSMGFLVPALHESPLRIQASPDGLSLMLSTTTGF